MGKLAHVARTKPGPVNKPRAAPPKAKTSLRAKASWTFGGFDGGKSLAAVGAQAKMEVSKPEDALEHEADRIADRVMHGHAGGAAGGAGPRDTDEMHGAHLMRACDSCADEDKSREVQRKAQSEEEIEREERRGSESADPMKHVQRKPAMEAREEDKKKVHRMAMGPMGMEEEKKVHRLAEGPGEEGRDAGRGVGDEFEEGMRFAQLGGGAALAGPLAAFMESRFGTSFRRVRVHVGEAGAALARSVRAKAFTVGRHIFFGPGAYRPHTEQGRRLIAHELTHVMQQRGGMHSVQREVEAASPADGPGRAVDERQAGEDEAAPDAIPFGRFMKLFDWREGFTPSEVLKIIREIVERALHVVPQAEKLAPLLDPVLAAQRTVRRVLLSRSHELRLETGRVGGSRARTTKWELRFFDNTRVDAKVGRVPTGIDEVMIDVGETGRPSEAVEPALDLKEDLAKRPSPATPAVKAAAEAPAPTPADEAAARVAAESDAATAKLGAAEGAAAEEAEAGEAGEAAAAAPAGPIAAAAATPGGPAKGAVSAAAKTAAAAAEEKIPSRPEDDRNFKAVVRGADRAKKKSAAHAEPAVTAVNAKESAPVDDAERLQVAQGKQVEKMSVQETPDFPVQKFIDDVDKQVADNTPKTLEAARNFKNDGVVPELARQVREKAVDEANKTSAPLAKTAAAQLQPKTVATRPGATLATAPIGSKPKDIDAGRAVPPERPRSQVEGEVEKSQQAVDAEVKQLGVPEERLREATDEPPVVAAVQAKDSFDANASAAPGDFRKGEASSRAAARQANATAGAQGLDKMFDTRSGLIGKVQKGQRGGQAKSVSQHEQVELDVANAYESAKGNVHRRLELMQKKVAATFESESKAALSDFENAVVDAEKRWNQKFVLLRGAEQIGSRLTKIPTALEADLRVIRVLFIIRMRRIVTQIAQFVASQLKAAKQEVKTGRAAFETAINTLGKGQEKLKAELTKEFGVKFDALELDIKKSRDAAVATVAQGYKESRAATEKLLADVRERNKGFVGKLFDKWDALKATLGEGRKKLEEIFHKAKGAIVRIVFDPKRFMKNLFTGIGAGFKLFGQHIFQHLVKGAINWLANAVGATGIEIPKPPFDGPKILSIFLQLTGLTIEHVKQRARIIWGDKVVDAIERGVAGAEKAFELFEVFKKEGVMGLIRLLWSKIVQLKDQAVEALKGAIEKAIVKKALEFLVRLLNPIGAIIQAIITIVNTVLFFVRNASRIGKFIQTIVDGVNDVLDGKLAAVALRVEDALAQAVPFVLDFMLTMIELGSKIVGIVKDVIEFIRKPVDQVIDFMLTGIKNLIGPFIARVMSGVGMKPGEPVRAPAAPAGAGAAPAAAHPPGGEPGAAPKAAGARPPAAAPTPANVSHIGRPMSFTFGTETHTLFFRQVGRRPVLMISSGEQLAFQFIAGPQVRENADPSKLAKANALVTQTQAAADEEVKIIDTHPDKTQQIAIADRKVIEDQAFLVQFMTAIAHREIDCGPGALLTEATEKGVHAILTPEFLSTHPGSEVDSRTSPGWYDEKAADDGLQRGHVLGRQLGGEGKRPNLVTMSAKLNSPEMRDVETRVKKAVTANLITDPRPRGEMGRAVDFKVTILQNEGGGFLLTRPQAASVLLGAGFKSSRGLPTDPDPFFYPDVVPLGVVIQANVLRTCPKNIELPPFSENVPLTDKTKREPRMRAAVTAGRKI